MMILREIYVKDNSVRRYDSPIVGLSRLEIRKQTGLSQSQFAKKFHLGIRAVQS